MLITGLEGPITISSAAASASSHLRRRVGLGDALELDRLDLGLAAVDDQVLLQTSRQPAAVGTRVRTGCSDIGSTAASTPSRARDLRLGVGVAAALGEEVVPVEAGGEVAVGEREPVRRAELRRAARRR